MLLSAAGGNRTPDPKFRKLVLSSTELRRRARGRDRTSGPLRVMEVRSHCATRAGAALLLCAMGGIRTPGLDLRKIAV